jgi:hypothetical protein
LSLQLFKVILECMGSKHLARNNTSHCPGDQDAKVCQRTWGRKVKLAARVVLGLALVEALLPGVALAGEPPRQPVRLSTWLDRGACAATPHVLRLSPEVALGLVAFNSPYLFGGRALRSQLTCGACHAKDGPSGAAVRLRLRAPVPDLRTVSARVDVAAFVDHAVVAEFDGPPMPQRTARALAALAGVLAPLASDPADRCEVNATALLAIGLQLAITRVDADDAEALDFLLDSLRFILGEMARSTPPPVPVLLLEETNRTLHDANPAHSGVLRASLKRLAERWEALADTPHLVLTSSGELANE